MKRALVAALACACSSAGPTRGEPTRQLPSLESRAKPSPHLASAPWIEPEPALQFPGAVAGYPFGIDGGEFFERCQASGGRPTIIRTAAPATIVCDSVAAGLPFPVELVTAYFCGVTACEYVLTIGAKAHDQVFAELERRNGPSVDMSNHRACATAGIRGWTDGTNRVRLYRGCDDEPSLLFYDDARGVEMRKAQAREQDSNF